MKRLIRIQEIYDHLIRLAPPSLAEDWDSVGLQVGTLKDELQGVLVSLDVTEAALWEAVEHDCNLLITHHPLFFKPLRRLDDATPVSRCARLAAQMGINILSFHTNLDATERGLNDQLADKLGIKKTQTLLPSRDPKHPRSGLGRIGSVPSTTLKRFADDVGSKLKLKNLRYVGDPAHPIRRVAVMTGSGGGYFAEAKSRGADVLVTGDVKYHQALDALAEGISIVDIGHYAGEIGMVAWLAKELRGWARRKQARIKIFETERGSDPFHFWPSSD
ncbi:MAG: Nif3-like dinuclear metal center hexameric protein [Deltaproteobacteria bacterium]|nr:Nif3-like dinuclear metal center hexameric protein [Deltaproteobacteria bacterium]